MDDQEVMAKALAFEKSFNHRFNDLDLLTGALVSSGYPNEHKLFVPKYRHAVLANLGDTVIGVLATEHLIRARQLTDEGQITLTRDRMISGKSLNELAAPMLQFLVMTSGERNALSCSRIPGESVEALVGALYLDGGLAAARRLLEMLGFFEKNYEE